MHSLKLAAFGIVLQEKDVTGIETVQKLEAPLGLAISTAFRPHKVREKKF